MVNGEVLTERSGDSEAMVNGEVEFGWSVGASLAATAYEGAILNLSGRGKRRPYESKA